MLAAPRLLHMGVFGSRNCVWFGFLKGLLPDKNVFLSKLICSPSFSPQFKIIKKNLHWRSVWHFQTNFRLFSSELWKSSLEIQQENSSGCTQDAVDQLISAGDPGTLGLYQCRGMRWYLGWDLSVLDAVPWSCC